MPSQVETHASLDQLAEQPNLGQIIWSDVVPEAVRLNRAGQLEDMWWRHTDTDAIVSSRLGNWSCVGMLEVPIGYIPWESIGLLQLDDRISKQKLSGNIIAIANRAPRGDEQVKDGANGEPYRVATTKSGLIVFASHLGALADLAQQGRLSSLYEIPKCNSGYDEHEQFRSSMVAGILKHTDELIPIYDTYKGTNLSLAGPLQAEDNIAYVDKFGNLIGRTRNISDLLRLSVGKTAVLQIEQNGKQHEVPVRRGTDLRSAKIGEITIYPNESDVRAFESSGHGIYEIIARVNDDPSHSIKTAMFVVQEQFLEMTGVDFDPFKATVTLSA